MSTFQNQTPMNISDPYNQQRMFQGQQQYFPYGNQNQLIMNSPYENYMGRQVQSQNSQMQSQYLKCRPVSSKDEARAFQIDLDGSLWVFTDVGNNHIYTKQINNDGTASFKTYALEKDEPSTQFISQDFVTKEQFNKVIQSLMAIIQSNPNNIQQSSQKQQQSKNVLKF